MPRLSTAILVFAVMMTSACATVSSEPASVVAVQQGEILSAEKVTSANTTGANSAVRIGAAVLGVLVPGPWGGVAGTAGGEAGRAVLRNTGGQWRYFVQMPDGAIKTIEQEDGPALTKGAEVDVIEMSDGSARVVAATEDSLPKKKG